MKARDVKVGYSIKLDEKGHYFSVKQIAHKVAHVQGKRTRNITGIIFIDVCGSHQREVHPDDDVIISSHLRWQLQRKGIL